MNIWIHAPKNFRPSNWVDMLRDIDVAFDLDPHLVDPSYVTVDSERHYVLMVMCTLLDEEAPDRKTREALFMEMMDRAAAIGLNVTVPFAFEEAYPEWWEWIQNYCTGKKILLRVHQPSV